MKIDDIVKDKNPVFDRIIHSAFFKANFEKSFPPYLYHGSNYFPAEEVIVKQKFRTEPRDTVKLVHNFVNDLSMEKLGIPIRNLLFTSTCKHRISDYGDEKFMVFPLSDDYKLFYNEVVDDFTEYYGLGYNATRLHDFIYYVEGNNKALYQKLPDVDWTRRDLNNEYHELSNNKEFHAFILRTIEDYSEFLKRIENEIITPMSGDEIEEISIALAKEHKNFLHSELSDYVENMIETKTISRSDNEVMVLSKEIAFVPIHKEEELLIYNRNHREKS